MRVVLASNNQNKLREMQEILAPLGWEILRLRDLGVEIDPEENGCTFEENSKIKAQAVVDATGLPAIADDSGIAVDALAGAPGVYSARYGGESCPDDHARNLLLLHNMEEVPEEQRGAKFVSVITMVTPEGGVVSARGELPGVILRGLVGDGGFGYDPLFYIPTEGCTMAQLTPQRKNQISHRAVALQQFLNQIHKIEENKEC
jgi:XTP/dITP diphosphohydrolase